MAVGHNLCGHLLSALICLDGVFASSGGQRCWMTKTTNIFSDEVETAFSCPQPGDPDHFTNCCGPSWQRKCCAPPTKFNHGPIGGGSVISFFGIVTGVVILVVCLVLICCCCTPCCLLAKQRRRRGLVIFLSLFLIVVHPQSSVKDIQSSGTASSSSILCWAGAKHASYHSTTLSPSRPSATWLPKSASPLPWTSSRRSPSPPS